MTSDLKEALYWAGAKRVTAFCVRNKLPTPMITVVSPRDWKFPQTCAYYRPDEGIMICVAKCAEPGMAGRQWSWPGYVVDRTPYGVLAHELGHHVDWSLGNVRGAYWSSWGETMRDQAMEQPLTSYCPNTAEWTAEMLRLFITNHDLLRNIRPRTHDLFMRAGLKTVAPSKMWDVALSNVLPAPERTWNAARNKINLAQRMKK